MNQDQTAKKITAYLDEGTAGLRPGTAYKLQLARQQALARLADRVAAPELVLAGAGAGTLRSPRPVAAGAPLWVGIVLIVSGFLYYQHWQSIQQVREMTETDAAILTSDLPVEAYLDRGFESWLRSSEP